MIVLRSIEICQIPPKARRQSCRKKEKEKRDAKDKREQDLRDEGKTNGQIADDEEVKKLKSEIEQLEEAKQKD